MLGKKLFHLLQPLLLGFGRFPARDSKFGSLAAQTPLPDPLPLIQFK
jgi:hypothetical protein